MLGEEDINNSILAKIGGAIAWLFAPLGWGDWQAAVASITGLVAKEMLVTSLSMVGAVILGDFGVKSGWFTPDALLYTAFITISNYSI